MPELPCGEPDERADDGEDDVARGYGEDGVLPGWVVGVPVGVGGADVLAVGDGVGLGLDATGLGVGVATGGGGAGWVRRGAGVLVVGAGVVAAGAAGRVRITAGAGAKWVMTDGSVTTGTGRWPAVLVAAITPRATQITATIPDAAHAARWLVRVAGIGSVGASAASRSAVGSPCSVSGSVAMEA